MRVPRKPAFVDNVIGLVIGPLFVLAEALFGPGWRPALRAAIEAKAGPTRINPPREAASGRSQAANAAPPHIAVPSRAAAVRNTSTRDAP
ncbi:hypothetical protein [Paraburkholderia adhaesiva]|uniref:hypothetical protein n=1 Tax=Paraburkholderia adhaesiva TaxID=2883244 RepID=UPI001F37B745|nr:hypothetical protein [Paraburkholderia adhaesiva]